MNRGKSLERQGKERQGKGMDEKEREDMWKRVEELNRDTERKLKMSSVIMTIALVISLYRLIWQ